MVERLVANEKVEGSTPFARSIKMSKSKILTSLFQKFLNDRDIRRFKSNFFYYLLFRLIRNFLAYDLIIKIYNFKIFGSIKKNETSYFLLKKCEFGDYEELQTIKKLSENKKSPDISFVSTLSGLCQPQPELSAPYLTQAGDLSLLTR